MLLKHEDYASFFYLHGLECSNLRHSKQLT